MAHFFLFSADDSKTIVTVSTKHLSAPEISSLVLSENVMVNRLLSYHFWDIDGGNIKKIAK